jgi:hypothetical protein
VESLPDPLPLRAHAVLCLQGFRGEGYSRTFADAMANVVAGLREAPDHPVRLMAEPGTLCAACPHLQDGCTLGGEGHEDHMRAHDEDVLARLGLATNVVLPWREVLALVEQQIQGHELGAICTTCPWLPLGYCAEGVDALRRGARP